MFQTEGSASAEALGWNEKAKLEYVSSQGEKERMLQENAGARSGDDLKTM